MTSGATHTARPAAATTRGAPASGGAAGFVVLTFAASWFAWGAAILTGGSVEDPVVEAMFLVGAAAPTVVALALRLMGRRNPRLASLRRAGAWASAALALGLLPALAAAFLPPLVGAQGVGGSAVTGTVVAEGGWVAFVVATLVAGPLSEEFGWRGYAQPRMRRRLSPARTSLVLGSLWGLWHVPLFFLPGTWQESVGVVSVQGATILLGAVPISALAWFVSERLRGGVPAAVLVHAVINASLTLFPVGSTAGATVFLAVLGLLGMLVLRLGRTARARDRLIW